jgi:hypothetical protein
MAVLKPILALNSIRGKSGKDTLIEHIEASTDLKVCRVAFADILKHECAKVLAGPRQGLAVELERRMHTGEKDHQTDLLSFRGLPDSFYKEWLMEAKWGESVMEPRSLRWHLQQYGTQFVREHLGRPNEWLDKGVTQILEGLDDTTHDLVVVTDMRLPNEYQKLVEMGATTVRIVRNWFIQGVDDIPFHISDIALMAHPFDTLVVNEWGKPEAMLDAIKEYLP